MQNVDALYWRAAGERVDKVDAVRVNEDVLCVFNATPLEKYESYRLFLDQWSRCDSGPDFAPTIYNLIDSLASFLEINRYSPHNGTQPKFLVDMLPEVHGNSSDAMLRRLLSRKGIGEQQLEDHAGQRGRTRQRLFARRSMRSTSVEFQMMHAAEDAARFLHHACRGLPQRLNGHRANGNGVSKRNHRRCPQPADPFYTRVIEHAVAYFGSRVLYPSRPPVEIEESPALSRAAIEKAAQPTLRRWAQIRIDQRQEWGYRIGSQIYDHLSCRQSKTERLAPPLPRSSRWAGRSPAKSALP